MYSIFIVPVIIFTICFDFKIVNTAMEYLDKAYSIVCCSPTPIYPDPYSFTFSGYDTLPQNESAFQSNYVKTSKYTWYSFLPKSLLLQFRRLANVYFLFVATLQTIPIISPLMPVTAWIPLSVVLTISIIREGYQDYQRYKSDKQMNHAMKTRVSKQGKFEEVQWSEVVIGNICQIRQDELLPADMILLGSSNPDGGSAFIQTASLDGQKNLKPRSAHKNTIESMKSLERISKFKGQWEGVVPDKDLHRFSSNMKFEGKTIVYEGDKQFLYRGSRLKNTKIAYGLVIYTGRNTKIMMNSQSSSHKMSQVEHNVNRILIFILSLQVILCTISAIMFSVHMRLNPRHIPYIPRGKLPIIGDSVVIFFSYFILVNTMIPISLIVSLQFVKLFQSYFINKDQLMYSQIRKCGVKVRTNSLNEQLGQIEYVFSDKTGTLTMNQMQFKIAVIGDHQYGSLLDDDREFHDQKLKQIVIGKTKDYQLNKPIIIKGQKQIKIQTHKQLCQQYLLALSTAHEVIAEPNDKGVLKYQGPSPDQITLVEAAKSMGFQFVRSNQFSTTVKIRGEDKTYDLLELFPFTSDRKRMSVIIECDGVIKMFTKGADNIIKQRLSKDSHLNLDIELNQFSKQGLRTLLVAMKTIQKGQYTKFKSSVQKLSQINRNAAYEDLISQLQSDLYLIGATAVLDRLQDFVPETIRDLIRANIKVWMLTGDKMQTAENIARNCNLFQRQFSILRFNATDQNGIENQLQKLVEHSKYLTDKAIQKGLIIQGSQLTHILKTQQGKCLLAELANNCQAVVCCRLLPLQKAQVVNIVKKKLNKITLAIGDGANDVPMIKAAHIGIGLFGEEGMSAVQASDYALPEFRMLWRLLFVHGRWNYMRISQMVLYFFFKNMLFTLPQFILAFYSAYSGQSMFDDWYMSLYNLVFTSVPLVVRAVLEQDVNYVMEKKIHEQSNSITKLDPVIERESKYLPPGFEINKYFYRLFPKIYFIGQESCVFNYSNYAFWTAEAIVESIIITMFSLYILGRGTINSSGMSSSFWLVGLTIYTAVICIVTFKICTHTKFISKIFLLSVFVFSFGLYIIYMWLTNWYFTNNIAGTTKIAFSSPKFYFTILFCICVVLFVDGLVLHVDFKRGGYASKMRQILEQNMEHNKESFDAVSLKITDGVSQLGNYIELAKIEPKEMTIQDK